MSFGVVVGCGLHPPNLHVSRLGGLTGKNAERGADVNLQKGDLV